MKIIIHKILPCLALFGILPVSFGVTGCSSAQEQAFLANAPAIISGSLATANDLYAAYAAANQQLNGQSLNVSTGLTAANAAAANLGSSNLPTAVNQVFSGLNNLAASIKAANPAATPAQIANAQSAQIVAAQTATQAAAGTNTTTAMLRVHFSTILGKLVVEKESPLPNRA